MLKVHYELLYLIMLYHLFQALKANFTFHNQIPTILDLLESSHQGAHAHPKTVCL